MNPKYKPGDIVYRPVHDYFDVDLSTSYVESWRIEDVYKQKDRQEPYTNIAYIATPAERGYMHSHIWEHEVYATEKEACEKLLELLDEDINWLDIKRKDTVLTRAELAARISVLSSPEVEQ